MKIFSVYFCRVFSIVTDSTNPIHYLKHFLRICGLKLAHWYWGWPLISFCQCGHVTSKVNFGLWPHVGGLTEYLSNHLLLD